MIVHSYRRSVLDPFREWDQVLRAYAAALDEHRTVLVALAEGSDRGATVDGLFAAPPPRFIPPAGIGPLPADLADRAQSLLRETEGLVALAAEVAGPEPAGMSVPLRPGGSPVPSGSFTMEQRL